MDRPKVSIVLPIYNVEEYLHECLRSVTRQTLHDIEIICVNDGSQDGSLTIVNEFAVRDDRIVVLDGPNGGYGKAMNRGIDRATGEYIGIVEPDDFIALDMYEDLYALASENDLDFVKADFYRFMRAENGDMRLLYEHLDRTNSWYGFVVDTSMNPETMRLAMNTWSGIYKRSFIEQLHIRHNETPGASFQDNGFWFQTFANAKRAMFVDRPYYWNRRDNPNSSVNDPTKVYCMNEEYAYIEGILRQNEDIWNRYKYIFWVMRFGNYRTTLNRIHPEYRLDYLRRFRDDFVSAREREELDESFFSRSGWTMLNSILTDPDAYYEKAERKIRRAQMGKSIGSAVTKAGRKVKTAAKKALGSASYG